MKILQNVNRKSSPRHDGVFVDCRVRHKDFILFYVFLKSCVNPLCFTACFSAWQAVYDDKKYKF